jgi:formate dehydrogenase assembly factor FdhD
MADESPVRTIQTEDGTTLVEIASASNSDEAELVCGFLENEGIPARVEHADARSILPTNLGQLGDVRVFVAQEDEQRAMALLKQREDDYEKLDDEGETVVTDEGPAEIDENTPPETE